MKESGIVIKNNNHSNKNKELKIIISNNYTLKQRVDSGFPPDRMFYDKWRAFQYAQRVKHLCVSLQITQYGID